MSDTPLHGAVSGKHLRRKEDNYTTANDDLPRRLRKPPLSVLDVLYASRDHQAARARLVHKDDTSHMGAWNDFEMRQRRLELEVDLQKISELLSMIKNER